MKTKLAIIGVGLIGGSLGLCLKEKLGDDIFITGLCRTQKSMDLALERGAVDMASADVKAVVEDADIIFLATPVLQMVPMLKKILPHLKEGAILTDAGSTKAYLWQHIKNILPAGIHYIAGHPMTGREKSGVEAASADLFVHKAYVIVEDTGAPPEAHERLLAILRHTEANFLRLDIQKHDRCASIISHVPHVTAAALVTLLNQSAGDMESCLKLAGGGFKDTTRIASSNADMWADICMTNSEAITSHLRDLQAILGTVIDAIEAGDREAVHHYFAASKERRDAILDRTGKMYDLV